MADKPSEIIKQDEETVTSDGERLAQLPHGVSLRPTKTHIDERGSLFEVFDPSWEWNDGKPFGYIFCFTVRPGIVKGWGIHKHHEDRYCIQFGELKVVLYDDRDDSPTKGLVSEIVLSEYNRCLLNIPAGIWHADYNIGTKDAVVLNCPTKPYVYESPDKYRLPIDNDYIPYKFKLAKGGG